jgi:hypothetical protein
MATPNASCTFRSERDAVFISPDFIVTPQCFEVAARVGALGLVVRDRQLPTGDGISMRREEQHSDIIKF